MTISKETCFTDDGNGIAVWGYKSCVYTGVSFSISASSITIPEDFTLIFNESEITTDWNTDIYNYGTLRFDDNTVFTNDGFLGSSGNLQVYSSVMGNTGDVDNGGNGEFVILGNPGDGKYGLTNSGTLTNHGYVVISTDGGYG